MNWNLEFQTRCKKVKIPEKKVAMQSFRKIGQHLY